MTDQTTEADASTATARPVRVPNVSPGAISGLGHEVIGSAVQEVYDAEAPYADDDPSFDPDNPDHVDALVSRVPEERQLAVRQALTGQVIDGQVVTDLDPAPRVEGTQAGADPASSLTGTGAPVSATPETSDPTSGALPTGDTVTVPEGLQGEALDAWVSGDAVEGDETNNPERWAAYQARVEAAQAQGFSFARPEVSLPDDLADTVDARVAWVHKGQDRDEVYDRAALLLRLEADRETQRTTLVEPLRAITDDYEAVPEPSDS